MVVAGEAEVEFHAAVEVVLLARQLPVRTPVLRIWEEPDQM